MEIADDGRIQVTAHQIVRPLDGTAPSDTVVRHIYTFDGETIARMDIVEALSGHHRRRPERSEA